jgi:hypothetical protein
LVERFFGHVQSMVSLAFSLLGACLHLLSPPAFNSLNRSLQFRFVQELDPVGVYPGRPPIASATISCCDHGLRLLTVGLLLSNSKPPTRGLLTTLANDMW